MIGKSHPKVILVQIKTSIIKLIFVKISVNPNIVLLLGPRKFQNTVNLEPCIRSFKKKLPVDKCSVALDIKLLKAD